MQHPVAEERPEEGAEVAQRVKPVVPSLTPEASATRLNLAPPTMAPTQHSLRDQYDTSYLAGQWI